MSIEPGKFRARLSFFAEAKFLHRMQRETRHSLNRAVTALFGDIMPFICKKLPFIIPIIGKKIPLVVERNIRGVTLIELIVTLTIAVILLSVAVPSMTSFLNLNRLVTANNNLVADLNLARNEAIKQASQVAICKSGGGATCVPTGGWQSGWIVFADMDTSGTWTASDVLLRRYEGFGAGITVTASSDTIVYDRQGATASTSFSLCDTKTSKRRTIRLTAAGHATSTEGTCP